MTDDSKIGLVIKRAKAMLLEIHDEVGKHREAVKIQKNGGKFAGGGPVLGDYWKHFHALEAAIGEYEETTGHVHIPFKAEVRGDGVHEEMRETHESYGNFSFHRIHGGRGATHLFGSHVEYHPVTIRLEIHRAERHFNKDLSSEHIYSHGQRLIEVEMSAAQFTDSITLMNHGEGIPCTIRYVGGAEMEDVPHDHRSEQHLIVEGFAKKMDEVREAVGPELEKIQSILEKKSIGKADRKEILWLFEKITRSFSDSAAFTMTRFNEATDKLTSILQRS